MKRVVVTGTGAICSLGQDWSGVRAALRSGRSGVSANAAYGALDGLQTRLSAPVVGFELPASWSRKKTRTMGRDSAMAVRATECALLDAGLLGSPLVSDGSTGIAFGSTAGSPAALAAWAERFHARHTLSGIGANEYIRFMSHTCAANIAQFFEVRGRVLPTCSACTSASQGIGYGYEAIKHGQQTVMLAGGAEELGLIDVAIFDILFAASTRNDEPDRTPRPFDVDRDGLVCSEGACTFVLEEREHALARGARIHAEILGFATNCDGRHMTNPDAAGMERVMRLALDDARLAPSDVGYVNAHATGTDVGDIAESRATAAVFGNTVPVSSLKGHLGHALGACGSIEAWITIEMLREGWVAPTRGLERVDPRCGDLDYVRGAPRDLAVSVAMTNNFAFGGVNTSILLALPDAS
ncbi:MAG: beta-ketoacyl-ACP synthase [Myxococcota bacterium]